MEIRTNKRTEQTETYTLTCITAKGSVSYWHFPAKRCSMHVPVHPTWQTAVSHAMLAGSYRRL